MVKLLILDVDGTMTDGGIYYDSMGNELKKFAVRDGAGLMLAHAAGLKVMICTGRRCEAVSRRAAELKLDYLFQDVPDKAAFVRSFAAEHGLARADLAYCGDDLNDLAAMAECGFVACPADAVPDVLARADYVCPQRGGEGAVRGAIEELLKDAGAWETAVHCAFGAELNTSAEA
jgi:3-deoxy-D-manno-octulosonate 8-phosphate phosphatase (KDO 8-P phosphatase)